MQISDRLRSLRTSKNLTQQKLADILKVTKSAVSAYEVGTRLPSYDVLLKIANIYHVSVDYLLGNTIDCALNVTGLTDLQRNTVQEIIDLYKLNNSFSQKESPQKISK